MIRDAASQNLLDLRVQPGARNGVNISDENMTVFTPISKKIEVGSDTDEKPNAIVLQGALSESPARAAGAEQLDDSPAGEIGNAALASQEVEAMQDDLDRIPPAKSNIAHRMNVFASRVEYIEFETKNRALGHKGVSLPDGLKTTTTKALQTQFSSRLRTPMAVIGAVEVVVKEGENVPTEKIDDKWLRNERKRIEDCYTFQIENFGSIYLREDWQAFDETVNAFKMAVSHYHDKARDALDVHRKTFCVNFVTEFLPRWKQHRQTL